MSDILPSYIPEPIGIPMLGKPYRFDDSKLGVFLLECEESNITGLLDTYINTPSNQAVSYKPIRWNGKALIFMIMAEMTVNAKNTQGVEFGQETYNEWSFWIPAIDLKNIKGGLFLPFLFPDQESPIATGREAFGFFKQLGSFRFGGAQWNPILPDVEMDTIAYETLGPDSKAELQQLLSLKVKLFGDQQEVVNKKESWANSEEVKAGISKLLGDDLSVSGSKGLTAIDIVNLLFDLAPGLFLKQFPSISDTSQASFQKVTQAHFKVNEIRSGFPYLPNSIEFTINELASHPIVSTLGLSSNQMKVNGFWVNIDFELEEGKVIGQPAKKKIAVLGGGLGAMSTAFALTSKPGWQELYDITVYQLGWRLGGKAASGRNREIYDRIEEHGLHIFFGYYENAFKVMRELYKELNRPANAPLATWEQAFKKHNTIPVQEFVNGKWKTWTFSFPPDDGVPGSGPAKSDRPWDFLRHFIELAVSNIDKLEEVTKDKQDSHESLVEKILGSLKSGSHDELQDMGMTVLTKALHKIFTEIDSKMEQKKEEFTKLQQKAGKEADKTSEDLNLLGNLEHNAQEKFEDIVKEIEDFFPVLKNIEILIHRLLGLLAQLLEPIAEAVDAIRRIFLLIQLGLVIIKGMIADGVILGGYDTINNIDFRDWLQQNGASETVYNSALINAFYDLYLSFPNGNTNPPEEGPAVGGSVSAGVLLHSYILTVACYKGAIFWKMQAGMGDVVMTPFYEVLRQRGVTFEFFHKVTDIKLNDEGTEVETIDMDVQATLKSHLTEYNPLYNVKELPCWPSAPLFEQLEQGKELKDNKIDLESYWADWQPVAQKTLQKGVDFDIVVLGISIGAFPYITTDLIAKNEAWRNMVENTATTQTQAMQLWLNYNLEETGWPYPNPVMDAYADPFNTWAVMDQLLIRENWPWESDPIAVFYLLNNLKDAEPIPPFTDHNFPAEQKLRVMNNGIEWLQKYSGHLWPYATTEPGSPDLNWDVLLDPENRSGVERMEAQYFNASLNPSDRYVINAANTNQYRLKPDGSTFGINNLYLTGDWTDNGFQNIGCVESTVMGGLLCSRAICGYPEKITYETPLGNIQRKPTV